MKGPRAREIADSLGPSGQIVDIIGDNLGDDKRRSTPVVRVAQQRTSPPETADDVYRRLREANLPRLLGAGRTAVRAALVRLDQEGLVTRELNRGARVRLVSDREALEIEEVRVILEQLIVRQAAQRITAADLRDLRRSVGQMRERLREGNPLRYSELNAEFHQRIWSIADHGTASRLLANLKSQSIRFQF